MPVELRWIANRSASCLHVLAALAEGRELVADDLGEALAGPAEKIAAMCGEAGVSVERLFDHLVPLSMAIETPANLATIALNKAVGPVATVKHAGELASLLTESKSLYAAKNPKLLSELALRGGPLRELWEARSPGVLAGIARQFEPGVLVDAADVILVQPVLGGGGRAHLLYNSIRIEAVLTNANPELPETVRMAWLLAALNFDLPKYCDNLRGGASSPVIRLALLPSTLAAAEDVELVRDPTSLLPRAIEQWNLGDAALAEPLAAWWRTCRTTETALPVALKALEEMIDA